MSNNISTTNNISPTKKQNIKKSAIILGGVFFVVAIVSFTTYRVMTKEVYYLNKDSLEIISNRVITKRVGTESDVQSFLRSYLAGDADYKSKIPFTHEARLLSVSHDEKTDILVLNWNSYFYKALEQDIVDQEIILLLYSLKRNFPISTVFFLVENAVVHISWGTLDLSQSVDLQNINLEKNLKK